MPKLRITTHGRLQEWVADEKGYFRDEGLDYELIVYVDMQRTWIDPNASGGEMRYGAAESFHDKRPCDVSSACHWAVNQASSAGHGRMYGGAYGVSPSGIFVAPESGIRRPRNLAGVDIGVGWHSGSHFSTVQMLSEVFQREQLKLKFLGRPTDRLDALVNRQVPAVNLFGAHYYVGLQLGYRQVVDTTFMEGFLVSSEADPEDVERYFRALRRAQIDIDLEPERYKHYLLRELPQRYAEQVDASAFGPGERIVFEPYTQEMFERTHRWMAAVQIFTEEEIGSTPYREAVLV
jgi:NitT/TauT family transport system substrate-binding protein